MKSALFWQVYERLAEDSTIESLPQRLVEAAFSGDKAIDGVLGDTAPEVVSQPTDAPVEAASEAIYLDKLEVTGFRGVGETTVVHFGKEPGLTLIVGRNGSGKSSLAEALEVLLTGDSLRWKNRKQKEWASGWKNLHHDGRTWIRGTFLGTGLPLQVTRSWDTEEYDDGTLTVDNEPAETIARWAESLETFRPMLSYNEMGTALDGGPSHLYDLLRGVLGMEALTRAGERLATARKRLALIDKGRKKLRDELDAKLNNADDDRVEAVRTALGRSKPDIDALLALIEAEAVDDTQVSNLRRVASIQLPNSAAVLSCSSALRDADSAYQLASRELGGLEAETVEILKLAVRFHDHSPGADCPVCGADGALDDAWNQKALEHVAKLESSTEAHKRSKSQLDGALRQAQQLITRTPSIPGAQLASADAANSAHQNWLQG